MKTNTTFLLLVILAVAAAMRLVALDASPPTLFRDEVEKGYNAYALLHGGEAVSIVPRGAYFGVERHPWPLFLNVYNSHTPMIYQYAAMPCVAALGLNAWGTRLPAAMAGTLAVLLTFLLAREALGRRAALYAAALLAVSPWHVMFSRWAQQGIMVPFFVTLGMWALMRWLRLNGEINLNDDLSNNRDDPCINDTGSPLGTAPPTLTAPPTFKAAPTLSGIWLMLAAAAFAMSFYAYDAGRVFVPLFLAMLLVLFWRPLFREWKWSLPAAVLLLLLSAPTLAFMLSPESRARYEAVSGGASPGAFIVNWFAHFNPAYLFVTGDANPRHSYPGFGQLHIVEALLWLAALPALWQLPRHVALMLIGWLALGAVPAALTTEGVPHALRSIVTLPAPAIISAIGAAWLHGRIEARRRQIGKSENRGAKIMAVMVCSATVAAFLGMFAWTVFIKYPRTSAPYWSYSENVIFDTQLMPPARDGDLNLVSPNLLYAPYFFLYHARIEPNWTPDYFPSSVFTAETGRQKKFPLFPTAAWRPEDLPDAITSFVWTGPPVDAWPGEVILVIPWPHPEEIPELAGQPAVVVRRVPRAALRPLPF